MIPTLPSSSPAPRRPVVLTPSSCSSSSSSSCCCCRCCCCCCWAVIPAQRASPASAADCAARRVGLELHLSPLFPNAGYGTPKCGREGVSFPQQTKWTVPLEPSRVSNGFSLTENRPSFLGEVAPLPLRAAAAVSCPLPGEPPRLCSGCLAHCAAGGQGGCACWRGGAWVWKQGALDKVHSAWWRFVDQGL